MSKVKDIFEMKIWMIRSRDLSGIKRFFLSFLRIAFLTGKLFFQNKCSFKASSLTFYTLFSFVPVAALVFGIAQGCGFSDVLESKTREWLSLYPDVAEKLITFTDATLRQAKGGIIAGAGVLVLIWTTIKLLSNIENTMNDIWGIPKGRSFIRKITDYIAIVIICPFMLLTAGSGLVVATTRVGSIVREMPYAATIVPVLGFLTKGLPFVSIWLVLCFIYIAIPNTRVKFRAAIPAGFVTALAYILLQVAYIYAQFMMVKYNTIYGSFAALPLLLLWLNLSWNLILAGAQMTFAIQNVNEYEFFPGDGTLSTTQRNAIALEFVARIRENFEKGGELLTEDTVSRICEVPIRSTRMILAQLVKARVLTEGFSGDNMMERSFQLARMPDQFTPVKVIAALENSDGATIEAVGDPFYIRKYKNLWESAAEAPENSWKEKKAVQKREK
ncbi:MAG: YihY/virulence factor BrkB family protein [Lentisphaeria bacterium]|nr:YihY/virulence factor BrkB family protein [Lentisphaeria bacterium]